MNRLVCLELIYKETKELQSINMLWIQNVHNCDGTLNIKSSTQKIIQKK